MFQTDDWTCSRSSTSLHGSMPGFSAETGVERRPATVSGTPRYENVSSWPISLHAAPHQSVC
jgi:hypothetical protein